LQPVTTHLGAESLRASQKRQQQLVPSTLVQHPKEDHISPEAPKFEMTLKAGIAVELQIAIDIWSLFMIVVASSFEASCHVSNNSDLFPVKSSGYDLTGLQI